MFPEQLTRPFEVLVSVESGEKLGELLGSQEKTFQTQEKSWEKSQCQEKTQNDKNQLSFECRGRRKALRIALEPGENVVDPGEKLGELLGSQEKTF